MDIFRLQERIPCRFQWQLFRLYHDSFPRYERKPFRIILSMWKKGKTDIWVITEKKKIIGFASTINGDRLILLDYLAILPKERGRGYGCRMLSAFREQYQEKGFFVEIESVYEKSSECADHIRRKRFYERNGLKEMRVLASVFDVPMELMGWNCQLDFQEYRLFYKENYSAFAAEHIHELSYPK